MNLLIIAQKLDANDNILGFFHKWVEEFALRADKLTVIAQFVGEYNLPQNVEVFSLGKEKKISKIWQLANFYRLLLRNLNKVDAVFVHMAPLWVILGGALSKIYGKKVYLWYVHKSVNFVLEMAEKMTDKIFTASKESCRLKSDKIVITGHGIDVDKFKCQSRSLGTNLKTDGKFKIITAGRIAPVKNYELLIDAAEILRSRNFEFEINIAGVPILEQDKLYLENLKKIISEKKLENRVNFIGGIPYKDIPEFYQKGDLFVNFSDTGSLDKAVLEAMAAGLNVLTSNEAFKPILPEDNFTKRSALEAAEKIIALSKNENNNNLRDYVVSNHSLSNTVSSIIYNIKNNLK